MLRVKKKNKLRAAYSSSGASRNIDATIYCKIVLSWIFSRLLWAESLDFEYSSRAARDLRNSWLPHVK